MSISQFFLHSTFKTWNCFRFICPFRNRFISILIFSIFYRITRNPWYEHDLGEYWEYSKVYGIIANLNNIINYQKYIMFQTCKYAFILIYYYYYYLSFLFFKVEIPNYLILEVDT